MNLMNNQNIKVKTMENSNVYQAGGDIHVNDIHVNDIPKALIEQLGNFLSSQEGTALLDKFLNDKIMKIKEFIEDGKANEAEYEIEDLIVQDSKSIPPEVKAKLYYYKGLIHFEKNDITGVNKCIKIIYEIGKELDKVSELQYRIAVQAEDDEGLERALKDLSKYENYKNQIELKRVFYELSKNKFSEVVSLLMLDKDIKSVYSTNDSALYYLGTALINMNRFEEASKYLGKAYEIRQLKLYKYNLLIAQVQPILQEAGAIFSICKNTKDFLNEKLSELLLIEDYFTQSDNKVKAQFWGYVLNIKLFIEPQTVINQYHQLSETVRKENIIQLMLAEAYNLSKNHNKAIKIYEFLHDDSNNPQILIKILNILMLTGSMEEVIDKFKNINADAYDDKGVIISIYLEALHNVKQFSYVKAEIHELESKFNGVIFFYCTVAYIFYKHEEYDEAYEFLEKATGLIVEDNDSNRIYVAETCFNMNLVDRSIELLRPLEKNNLYARRLLLGYAFKINSKESISIAENIVDRELQNGSKEEYILNAKGDILLEKECWEDALNIFKKLFNAKSNKHSAYNIIAIKINSKDVKNLEKYVRFLENSDYNKPDTIMLLALYYKLVGNQGISEELAFKAVYKLQNIFDASIFLQYINFYFHDIAKMHEDTTPIEYKNVKENTVTELIDEVSGKKMRICIHGETNLVVEDGEESIGCNNYSNVSSMAIRIINKSIGELLHIGGIAYRIKSITNKNVYALWHCTQIYAEKYPESPSFKVITVNDAEDINRKLMPILKAGYEQKIFLLGQYNFANGIGLPIATLCNKDYTRYCDTIIDLLNSENQIFYSGELNEISLGDIPIVLTLSSIIILKLFNKLSNLLKYKNNIYVCNSLVEKIKEIFRKTYSTDRNIFGTVGLSDNEQPIFNKITEEQTEARLDFWRDIVTIVEEFIKVQDISWEYSGLTKAVKPLVDDFELDCIFLSKQLNGIYISEDLFLRKLGRSLVGNLKNTNFISILRQQDIVDFNEYLDIIYRISSGNYAYVCNEVSLYEVLNKLIIDDSCQVGEWIRYSKVYNIILNLLSNKEMFSIYHRIVVNVLFRIYNEKRNYKSLKVIYIITQLLRTKQLKWIDT